MLKVDKKKYVPLVVKVAPDLNKENAEYMCEKITEYELDGVITTNTTLDRPSNLGQNEEGGLMTPPFQKSLETLKLFRSNLHPNCLIVGVGGISNEEKAKSFLNNGAHLIQVYTGFVYNGTKMVHKYIKNLIN